MYYYFNVNGVQLAMPKSTDLAPWVDFFNQLMQKVPSAPMHALLAMCNILYDILLHDVPRLSSDDEQDSLCYDTAIMMAAEDENPASEAAVKTGFYAKGFAQLIDAAGRYDFCFDTYVTALDVFLSRGDIGLCILDQQRARKLVDWYVHHILKLPINR